MKSKNSYYLVLEYCNGGDLASYIDLVGKVNEETARIIVK
jgi:serine/threonine protein kinase